MRDAHKLEVSLKARESAVCAKEQAFKSKQKAVLQQASDLEARAKVLTDKVCQAQCFFFQNKIKYVLDTFIPKIFF